MAKYVFKGPDGEEVSFQDICDKIERDYDYKLFIGTDSQVHRKLKGVMYATCVILYKQGKGGTVFVCKAKEKFAASLRERLMNEVWRSLEVSFELQKILPKNATIVIHVDVNKSRKYKSGDYYEELKGMVTGQGFECFVKPYAWAAQAVADRFSR